MGNLKNNLLNMAFIQKSKVRCLKESKEMMLEGGSLLQENEMEQTFPVGKCEAIAFPVLGTALFLGAIIAQLCMIGKEDHMLFAFVSFAPAGMFLFWVYWFFY